SQSVRVARSRARNDGVIGDTGRKVFVIRLIAIGIDRKTLARDGTLRRPIDLLIHQRDSQLQRLQARREEFVGEVDEKIVRAVSFNADTGKKPRPVEQIADHPLRIQWVSLRALRTTD